jgi:DNA (cytosine-5)-methyltransferase 1
MGARQTRKGDEMTMTAVSLFAGVGGFDLALERNGIKVVASVEIDKKASEVLAKHFPNSKLFGDIQEVTGEQLINAGFDPSNGIIVGGFPCQDLSIAGKRSGLAGKRSGLFWEICRLLDETRAQNFILENVPGLLSSNQGSDMAAVVEALVERGYGIAWRVLDAQHFGVPQRRKRVFIVGCLGDSGATPAKILALSESRSRYLEASEQKRKDIAPKIANGTRDESGATFRMRGFGDYTPDDKASTMKRRDYLDATDLVVRQK